MSGRKSNVINIKARMREEAYYKVPRGCKVRYKVSEKAVREEISYINALIEAHMNGICKRLYAEGKQKTVLEEDIIRENGKIVRRTQEMVGGADHKEEKHEF